MRCLHTIGSLHRSSGGPAYNVAALCDALAQAGAEVEIVTQKLAQAEKSKQSVSPSLTHVIAARGFASPLLRLSYAPGFRSVVSANCADWRPHVLHDHGLWLPNNHASAAVARRFGLPLVVSPRGMLEPWALNYRSWKKRLAWWLYQRQDLNAARVLHATAEQEAENLRRLELKQPIAVIPNGVVLPTLGARAPHKNNEHVALFLSRIHPKKGLLQLVEAWKQAKPSGWKLIVAGPDEAGHRRVVEAAIRHAGLERVFKFIGPVDGGTKTDLYRGADLFILPSFSENFGVVVAEALACAVPVITTKGTPWCALEKNNSGWWIEVGVKPLVDAIRQATSLSDSERSAMGLNGRSYVAREFGWRGIAEQMMSVYDWMAGAGHWPDILHR